MEVKRLTPQNKRKLGIIILAIIIAPLMVSVVKKVYLPKIPEVTTSQDNWKVDSLGVTFQEFKQRYEKIATENSAGQLSLYNPSNKMKSKSGMVALDMNGVSMVITEEEKTQKISHIILGANSSRQKEKLFLLFTLAAGAISENMTVREESKKVFERLYAKFQTGDIYKNGNVQYLIKNIEGRIVIMILPKEL